LIGFFSVLGICLVLFAVRLSAARGNVQNSATATPLKYQYLATEPGVVLPTDIASPTEELITITPTFEFALPSSTPFAGNSPVPLSTSIFLTSASTSISTSSVSVSTGTSTSVVLTGVTNTPSPTVQNADITYDDTDSKFSYTGSWVGQTGVSNTYLNTLHVSNTIGDAVQLGFVGQKIHIDYEAGPNQGAIAIKIDGVDFALDQSATATVVSGWESPVLALSSHTVTITHISGGSINFDSITVLNVSTPTPGP